MIFIIKKVIIYFLKVALSKRAAYCVQTEPGDQSTGDTIDALVSTHRTAKRTWFFSIHERPMEVEQTRVRN